MCLGARVEPQCRYDAVRGKTAFTMRPIVRVQAAVNKGAIGHQNGGPHWDSTFMLLDITLHIPTHRKKV